MYSPMQDAAVRMGEQVYAAWAALRLGLLLGDAVDVAAAEGDLPGLDPHDLAVREHLLQLLDGQPVVFVAVLGGDNGPVDDEKVHIRGDADLAVFPGGGALHGVDGLRPLQIAGLFRQAQLVHRQAAALGIGGLAQGAEGVLGRLIEGVLRVLGPDARHLSRGHEAGHGSIPSRSQMTFSHPR